MDSRTDGDPSATVIGIEAKRYGAATPLPLDEIKSKLRDAATAHPDLELWVLVASREVKEPDAGQMRALGDTLGIEVLLLDWPESAEILPGLALLASAHEDVLAAYITVTPGISNLLERARVHPTYASQLGALKDRLLSPTLGYQNARDAVSEHFRHQMASLPSATARVGRYTNLTDPSVIRIARPELRQAVSSWWSGSTPRPALILLGAEGLGKTWAALSWWLDRELSGSPLPLTLIIPARFIANATPDAVIGTALHQVFAIRDPAWWARRARRWCAGAIETRLILIVDGLNERFDGVDWARLASEISLEPWGQAIAIIFTDRWDHWRLVPASFQAAAIPYAEQTVNGFSDSEMDEVLGRAGLERTKLDPGLIPLMKVPRLCALAIRHWEKLGRSGDITPERLVYEDFKDRIYPGLDDEEMRNLIAGIGQEILAAGTFDATVLRRRIGEALAEESGTPPTEATVSSIVSGVWFEAQTGEPHRFRINPELAPIAMGLALVRAVQSLDTVAEVSSRIEGFVDDLRGLELGVTVIGIAASFATIWPDCSPVARGVLLDQWLGSDNFFGDELKRYTRLIAEDPALFLARTEVVWRDRQKLHDDRNIHLAGLVNAAEEYPAVMTAFVERATFWLGETFGWRDVVNETDPPPEIAAPAVESRVRAWNETRGSLPPLTFKASAEEEDWVSVASPTISAISYLPRAPFAAALGSHAVATSIMREVNRRDQFDWLMRANTEDPREAETELVATARSIAAVASDEALAGADLLLSALSSLDPDAQPSGMPEKRPFGRKDSVERADVGALQWKYVADRSNANWAKAALRYATDLAKHAPDPNAQLDAAGEALLRESFSNLIAADDDREFQLSDEIRIVLARWAPDLLATYLNRIDAIDTSRHDFGRIVGGWISSLVTHGELVRNGIRAAFETTLRAHREASVNLDPNLTVLTLAGATPAAQLDALLKMPKGPSWPKAHIDLLKRPTAAEFARLETVLTDDADPALVAGWLTLLAHSDLNDMPPGYAPVARLMRHPDTKVRAAAMHVAWQADDKILCNRLRDDGWTTSQMEGDEALHGSTALCCAEPIDSDNRSSLILPLAIGCLSRTWPDQSEYREAFARHVEQRIRSELNPPRSSEGFGYRFDDRLSYRKLVEANPERVEQWIAPALEGARIPIGHMLFSADQAIIEVTRALLWIGRPSGQTLWRALVKSMNESSVRSDGLRLMPFETPLNSVVEELRHDGLDSATLDQHLFDIASALRRRKEEDWLITAIRPMLKSSVYDLARAIVLAGELDNHAGSEALWDDILALKLSQWLDEVRDLAWRRYLSNIQARNWLGAFITAPDPITAFSAFELFRLTASRTAGSWATTMMESAKEKVPARWYDHWLINVPGLNAQMKAVSKAAKDHLAFTRVPRHEQAPWR
ncbi:MAG TPA: hypothetical protein VIT45_16845 [Allosphingosinicella sp.]